MLSINRSKVKVLLLLAEELRSSHPDLVEERMKVRRKKKSKEEESAWTTW